MNEVVPRRSAAAYRHPLFICIDTWSGYRSTAFDPQGVEHLLRPDDDESSLGLALNDALSKSRFASLVEGNWGDFFKLERIQRDYALWVQRLMDRYGLKTKRALFKDLDYCSVDLVDGVIHIKPKCHVKMEGWEQPSSGPLEFTTSADSPPARRTTRRLCSQDRRPAQHRKAAVAAIAGQTPAASRSIARAAPG